MFKEIVVPLDGSDLSAKALPVAVKICQASQARLNVISFADGNELDSRRIRVEDQVAMLNTADLPVNISVVTPSHPVAEELGRTVDDMGNVLVCMTTHGRSRSEALSGSIASSLLLHLKTPVLLVGPDCEESNFSADGPMAISVTASETSETILPAAIGWAKDFGNSVEIVTVLEPRSSRTGSLVEGSSRGTGESNQVERLAHKAQRTIGRDVNFEVLHGKKPAKVLLERANSKSVNLLAMATHGASGIARIAAGSVTANVVRHAKCPVLVLRPEPK